MALHGLFGRGFGLLAKCNVVLRQEPIHEQGRLHAWHTTHAWRTSWWVTIYLATCAAVLAAARTRTMWG